MSAPDLLYLSRADVESVALDMASIIGALETAFREKGQGRIEMPPETGINTQPDAFVHAMPAYIPSLRSAGIKWVSGYPGNQERGLPYISGLLVLNDDQTGLPYAVMDCTWITAYRTGAASAVTARYLAREDSEVVGILACGVQGRANLLAMAGLSFVFMLMTFVVFAAYGVFAAAMRDRIIGKPAVMAWMRRTFAAAFVLLGLKLAFTER